MCVCLISDCWLDLHEVPFETILNLTSPGFPGLPLHTSSDETVICDWVISGADYSPASLHVVAMSLPAPDAQGRCTQSYLEFGGFDAQGRRVRHGRVCGSEISAGFVSRGARGVWATLVWWLSLTTAGHSSGVEFTVTFERSGK